jgi:hypothetical protein
LLRTLFVDIPARREDYETVTQGIAGSGLFPLKYCSHRWLENSSVAQRAIDMLPAIKCYLKALKDGKYPSPKTKSFQIVKESCEDVLLEAKLACFVSIAKAMEPFLTQYQTHKVMLPFLCEDLEKMLKNLR